MITLDKDRCPQDHRCPMIARCPQQAISQFNVNLPTINYDLCVECMDCVMNCPREAFVKV